MRRRRVPRKAKVNVAVVLILIVAAMASLIEKKCTQDRQPTVEPSTTAQPQSQPPSPPQPAGYPHLAMGNPSGATTDPDNRDNYLMEKPQYALSYNNTAGGPNWVSWRLTRGDLGDAPRGQFYPDQALPRGFVRITPRDYTGSGFDRGHMCPHADRDATREGSAATFAMSNIIPQSPNLNQKAWSGLEDYCRGLAQRGNKTLYIVCGPAGRGGEGSAGRRETIGSEHRVAVPAQCWKVIMVLDGEGGNDLEKVGRATRLIAVIMPNDMTVDENWARWRVPVSQVETLTGYRFFDKVAEDIIAPLKAKADAARISAARPRGPGEEATR